MVLYYVGESAEARGNVIFCSIKRVAGLKVMNPRATLARSIKTATHVSIRGSLERCFFIRP
jgi:hypothetical protein